MASRQHSAQLSIETPFPPPPSASTTKPPPKRKVPDEDVDLSGGIPKRRKDANGKPSKSKTGSHLNGERKPGGLVIIREPPLQRPSTTVQIPPPGPPSMLTPTSQSPPVRPLQPASSTATSSKVLPPRTQGKSHAKNRDISSITGSSRLEPEVDEDVRQMDVELGTLRSKARADVAQSASISHPLLDLSFALPKNKKKAPPNLGSSFRSPVTSRDALEPVPLRETPQISKNRDMRREARRSSFGNRGKRLSESFGRGIVAQPHSSVPTATFHKHIDAELPESLRARHLLLWCSNRTAPPPPAHLNTSEADALPPLSTDGSRLLKQVQDEVMKMLAEGKIEINVWSSGNMDEDGKAKLKENEQNVKNRKREDDFARHITQCKAEEAAWLELIKSYNTMQESVVTSLTTNASTSSTATPCSKGKQKAEDSWEPWVDELEEKWQKGNELAKAELEENSSEEQLNQKISRVGRQVDALHQSVHTASRFTAHADRHLDRFLSSLSNALRPSSRPALPASSTPLTTQRPLPPKSDPLDLLRALARTDASRPEGEVGEAARRARAMAARPSGAGDRKVTAVGAPTPRKPPGTPRRSTRRDG